MFSALKNIISFSFSSKSGKEYLILKKRASKGDGPLSFL